MLKLLHSAFRPLMYPFRGSCHVNAIRRNRRLIMQAPNHLLIRKLRISAILQLIPSTEDCRTLRGSPSHCTVRVRNSAALPWNGLPFRLAWPAVPRIATSGCGLRSRKTLWKASLGEETNASKTTQLPENLLHRHPCARKRGGCLGLQFGSCMPSGRHP